MIRGYISTGDAIVLLVLLLLFFILLYPIFLLKCNKFFKFKLLLLSNYIDFNFSLINRVRYKSPKSDLISWSKWSRCLFISLDRAYRKRFQEVLTVFWQVYVCQLMVNNISPKTAGNYLRKLLNKCPDAYIPDHRPYQFERPAPRPPAKSIQWKIQKRPVTPDGWNYPYRYSWSIKTSGKERPGGPQRQRVLRTAEKRKERS